MTTQIEASLEPIEDYVGVDLDVTMTLTAISHPIEQVGSREAGYTVGPWVPVQGVPVAMSPTCRTGVEISGFTTTPGLGVDPADVAVPSVCRWLPTDYVSGLWPGRGEFAFDLTTEGEPPAQLNDDFAYTVNGRWYSGVGVDFSGAEALSARVPSAASVGFVMAATLYRNPSQLSQSYGILETANIEDDKVANAYLGMRYSSDDRVQVWHQRTPVTTAAKVTGEDEIAVLGVWSDDETDELLMYLLSGKQRAKRRTYTDSSAPNIPAGGTLLLGRSSGRAAGNAVMRVFDLALVTDAEMFRQAFSIMAGFWVAERSPRYARA